MRHRVRLDLLFLEQVAEEAHEGAVALVDRRWRETLIGQCVEEAFDVLAPQVVGHVQLGVDASQVLPQPFDGQCARLDGARRGVLGP